MESETDDLARMIEALGAFRQELGHLAERVAALEKAPAPAPVTAPAPVAARPEGLGEELLLVLGAAIAAYLGKSAHIRQIRLIGSTAWAQQGRVTIQASHALSVQHG